jgi:hypothetical protein
LRRRLGYEGDVLQALRECAGVVHLLGIGVSWGDGARLRLKREVDARRALRWGAGDVDSLVSWRSAASRSALVAPPPPPMAGERTGRARMLFFHHAGKTSSIPPPVGGLSAAIVVVARRWKEYHVVAAVEGHELKTPEMEHRPGLKRLLETAHLELDGPAEKARARERRRARDALEKRRRQQEREGLPREPSPETPDDDDDDGDEEEDDMARSRRASPRAG